jgi:hypothetical protein
LTPTDFCKSLGEALLKAAAASTGRAIPVEIVGDFTPETLGRAVIRVSISEPAEDHSKIEAA